MDITTQSADVTAHTGPNGEAPREPAPESAHDGFPVSATSLLSERRLHTLKQGDMFGVFDQTGDILWGPGVADGIYFRDTRYLSALSLSLMGQRPILLSSTVRENNVMLSVDLTNTDISMQDNTKLDHDLLHVRRSRFLWNKTCYERMEIRNFDVEIRDVALVIGFGADFADLFEARGSVRARRGTIRPAVIKPDRVELSYDGLDDRRRTTMLRFSPEPTALSVDKASFNFRLSPGERVLLHYEIECDPDSEQQKSPAREFLASAVEARRALRLSSSRAAAVATSNEIFNEAIRRCICDIYMLLTDKPTGPYPYAGVPWYSTAFGRDALITAMQTLWLDPAITRGVLNYLALHQADKEDPVADAEPGKILHEVRNGEMAELGEVPFRHYYGSVDSTPLFVMLAGEYLQRTGDVALMSRLWPHIERAIEWIDKYGDRDGDGFVEYGRRNSEGLVNQGWKDSFDSIFHADGSLAEGPIALCEVQAYVYAAFKAAAQIGHRLGQTAYSARMESQAEQLKIAFNQRFWVEELGTYALALDGKKVPCKVRSSNAGHLLLTDIIMPDRVPSVVANLMSRASFSGWGIRTIPRNEARYNPMAYHNGSVWPHDNALIGLGLARHGYRAEAARLFHGLFDASFYTDLRRLPELFCGFGRSRNEGPVRYPVACSPQAWAAASLPALLQATLGLSFDPGTKTVHFRSPKLPSFVDQMTLYNLAVAGESVTVNLTRIGDEVAINVVERTALIKVQITT